MQFQWKIGGEAGFGIVTTGVSLSKIAMRMGYHVFDYAEYPSLIRGGHNTYETVISDGEVSGYHRHVDLLICLNQATYTLHNHRLDKTSMVMYDPELFEPDGACVKVGIPFRKIREEQKAMQVMVNTIALGASLALMSADIHILYDLITAEFSRKGEEVVTFNTKLAQIGYEYIKTTYPALIKPVLQPKQGEKRMLLAGNDAFSLAAVAADCRLYAAYPMTPASSVLTTLASWQKQTGMVIRHAEDEISVINTALGSAFTGVRSAVGTSGGGFALMVESISFSGVAEIPIVIFLSQRPGPATGIPTWTEQGDLLFACFAGHGEFPKIVLAPGDAAEMIQIGMDAFNLADIYQLPVIVLSDKCLSENHIDVSADWVQKLCSEYKVDRGAIVTNTKQEQYLRYKITKNGISEMLIPGAPGKFYQSNSYEHIEDSHTTEDSAPRIAQVQKRSAKIKTYFAKHFQLPTVIGDAKTSEYVFVSWGGTKGVVEEARRALATQNIETAHLHFTHIYPLDAEKIKALFVPDKQYVLVENNGTAQFGQLLRMQTGIDISQTILKCDGRPIETEEIVAFIQKLHQK